MAAGAKGEFNWNKVSGGDKIQVKPFIGNF
jgi:hypothetical protein